jgi:hypothetical protein
VQERASARDDSLESGRFRHSTVRPNKPVLKLLLEPAYSCLLVCPVPGNVSNTFFSKAKKLHLSQRVDYD